MSPELYDVIPPLCARFTTQLPGVYLRHTVTPMPIPWIGTRRS
jgi:hypothetical protein